MNLWIKLILTGLGLFPLSFALYVLGGLLFLIGLVGALLTRAKVE